MNAELASILRIKHMAQTAGQVDQRMTVQEADEVGDAYDRLRAQARALTARAGWRVDEFDAELPELGEDPELDGGDLSYRTVSRGQRARVLLGQLAAWATGYQETFELEATLEANARAKAEQTRRGPTGFAPRSDG